MPTEEKKAKENINQIYSIIHRFRDWNREWDLYAKKNPQSIDELVSILSKQYEVKQK